MKYTLADITAVICNWMQTRFTLGAVNNIKKYYPDMRIIVVDDGSGMALKSDFDRAYQRPAYSKDERFDNSPIGEIPDVTVVKVPKHVGHGSAIDYGLDNIKTGLMLTMDNDIRIVGGGLVEEYLDKLNTDPENIYAVGTTYTESQNYAGSWIDPWFSLYQVQPIRELHLTFSNFLYPVPKGNTFHIGTGAFLHTMLTYDTLHRPKIWKAVHYPEPEKIARLWHLKKHPEDPPNHPNFINWNKYIDG